MSVIFVLLPLALLFVGVAVAWFIWAVRSGQFDDLETPPVRMLFDDQADSGARAPEQPGDAARASSREVENR